MSTKIDPEYAEPAPTTIPERKLWTVCLLDGVRDARLAIVKRRKSSVEKDGSVSIDELWLRDKTANHVGSFVWICYHLNLDPDATRALILSEVDKCCPL